MHYISTFLLLSAVVGFVSASPQRIQDPPGYAQFEVAYPPETNASYLEYQKQLSHNLTQLTKCFVVNATVDCFWARIGGDTVTFYLDDQARGNQCQHGAQAQS
ncbi:MAG: hypothetical protein M1838_005134 [Thelocarpon superellum]|nr:MAG: hypothetical protein M1838_005134 [Thelocarpon superellum]